MSSIEQTPIEEKKKESNIAEEGTTLLDFCKQTGYFFLKLLIVVLIGVYIVYAGKVFNSGVFTLDTDCEPYTDKERTIDKNATQFINIIDTINENNKQVISGDKINFAYDGPTLYSLPEYEFDTLIQSVPIFSSLNEENQIKVKDLIRKLYGTLFGNKENKFDVFYAEVAKTIPEVGNSMKGDVKDSMKNEISKLLEEHLSSYKTNMKILTEGYLGIGYLKSWINGDENDANNTSPLWIYFGSIQEEVFLFFAKYMSFFIKMFDDTLPESWIIFLFGPLFLLFAVPLLCAITFIYGIVLSIKKISYFLYTLQEGILKSGTDKTQTSGSKWEWPQDDGYLSTKIKLYLWYFIYLLIAVFLVFAGVLPGIVGIITIIMILKVFILSGSMIAKKMSKPGVKQTDEDILTVFTFMDALFNAIKFKRRPIMIILLIYILIGAYGSFGGSGFVSCIFAFIFLYMFLPDIYKQYVPDDNDNFFQIIPLTVYNSSRKVEFKKCKKDIFTADAVPVPVSEENDNNQSLLGRFLSIFGIGGKNNDDEPTDQPIQVASVVVENNNSGSDSNTKNVQPSAPPIQVASVVPSAPPIPVASVVPSASPKNSNIKLNITEKQP